MMRRVGKKPLQASRRLREQAGRRRPVHPVYFSAFRYFEWVKRGDF
jgi:hypothetical protein